MTYAFREELARAIYDALIDSDDCGHPHATDFQIGTFVDFSGKELPLTVEIDGRFDFGKVAEAVMLVIEKHRPLQGVWIGSEPQKVALEATPMTTKELRFVFDAFPSPEGARFIEVEDEAGHSVNVGEWRQRPDGLVELVVKVVVDTNQDNVVALVPKPKGEGDA